MTLERTMLVPRSISRKSVRTGLMEGPDALLKKPGESPRLPSTTKAGPNVVQLEKQFSEDTGLNNATLVPYVSRATISAKFIVSLFLMLCTRM